MARWKLTEPHYLNVPGTFWEQVVNDRVTQRPIRKQFPVPLHLDPRIESDWNEKDIYNPMDGTIVVAWGHDDYIKTKGPRDIVFIGNPTPGMLPMDDEAKAISAKFDWTPTQGLDDLSQQTSHQAKILDGLITRLAEANVSAPGGMPQGFEKFMSSMASMMEQQTQLLAMLLQKTHQGEFEAQARAAGAERPVQLDGDLENAEPTAEELAKAEAAAHEAEQASMRKATEVAASGRRA